MKLCKDYEATIELKGGHDKQCVVSSPSGIYTILSGVSILSEKELKDKLLNLN